MNKLFVATLALAAALTMTGIQSQAQELPRTGLYADYEASGLQATGNNVTAWNSSPVGIDTRARTLDRIVESPKLMSVLTPTGRKNVLALDGKSSVWGTVQSWGSISSERTIIVLARVEPGSTGTLFDGSTLVGLSRAQIKDGIWQVGSDKRVASTLDAKYGVWQLHAFTFHPQFGAMMVSQETGNGAKEADGQLNVPQGGLSVGTDATRKNGLKAQVGEILVYNRALGEDELGQVGANITKRWGPLDALGAPEAAAGAVTASAECDRAAIVSKLADTTTPLIWLWCGDSVGEQGSGQARSVAQNFAERVRWEKNRRRDIVIDQTAPGLDAAAINAEFNSRVALFHPAVVVLSPAGDVSTASQLVETVTRIRDMSAIPVLQSNGANAALVKSVAQSQNVLLVESDTASPAALTLALFDVLGLKDPASGTVKLLAG